MGSNASVALSSRMSEKSLTISRKTEDTLALFSGLGGNLRMKGFVYVSILPQGPGELAIGSFLLGGRQAMSHFGILMRLGEGVNNWVQLERLRDEVLFQKVVPGCPLRNGAVLACPFEATAPMHDVTQFVRNQTSAAYHLVDNNCKHLVYHFHERILRKSEDFLACCRRIEAGFLDWMHHPFGPALLQADSGISASPLPVTWLSWHTEVMFFAGRQHNKLMELVCGHFNKWQWQYNSVNAPGLAPGQCLALIGKDESRHIFYMKSAGILGELHMGKYNKWQWHFAEHSVSGSQAHVPLSAGSNGGSDSVFWAGTNLLHEFHRGDYNGWKWQCAQHRVKHLSTSQPLATIFSNSAKKVFWLSAGSLWEYHMGNYNGWKWAMGHHNVPCCDVLASSLNIVASCDAGGEYVFWADADSRLEEMFNCSQHGWQWRHCQHKAPTVKKNQQFAVKCCEGGKRVFWIDSECNLQQLHQIGARWAHKTIPCGENLPWKTFQPNGSRCPCYLPNTAFKNIDGYFIPSQLVKKGDRIGAISGNCVTVVRVVRHEKQKHSLVRLTTAQGCLTVSVGHRVPASKDGHQVTCAADELDKGDEVYVGKHLRRLTKCGMFSERTELFEISFEPDEPVEGFLIPDWGVNTLGHARGPDAALMAMFRNIPEEDLLRSMPQHYTD